MELTLVVAWIAFGLALSALCAFAWLLVSTPTDGALLKLAAELKRSRKADALQRVRDATAEARAASAPLDATGKPFPFGPLNMHRLELETPASKKDALRRRVFGSRLPPQPTMKGNGNEPPG